MLGEIRSAFYLLGSFRKKLLLKRGGRLRAVANSLSCSLHPSCPPTPPYYSHPHGSFRKPQSIDSHQSPSSPCFLLPSLPQVYFRPSRLEDRSAIIEATTSSLRGEGTEISEAVRWAFALGCHRPMGRHFFETQAYFHSFGFCLFSPQRRCRNLSQ